MTFADVPAPPVEAHQNLVEFGALWEYIAARPHARVLEIGSLFGGTLWYWSRLPHIQLLAAVDLPSTNPKVADGVRKARLYWHDWFEPLVSFRSYEADSQREQTVAEVADALDGELFDFAFIDGDHTYEGVRRDWELWSPLVRPFGVIALHDTWPNGDRHEPGVVRFVDELRHQHPTVEWTDSDGVGICAVTLG